MLNFGSSSTIQTVFFIKKIKIFRTNNFLPWLIQIFSFFFHSVPQSWTQNWCRKSVGTTHIKCCCGKQVSFLCKIISVTIIKCSREASLHAKKNTRWSLHKPNKFHSWTRDNATELNVNGNKASCMAMFRNRKKMKDSTVRPCSTLYDARCMFVYFRFNDAGYYFWRLSMQCLDIAGQKQSGIPTLFLF